MNIKYLLEFFYIIITVFSAVVAKLNLVRDNYFGLSTVIGPDTYGLLNQYKSLYTEGFEGMLSQEFSVSDYLTFWSKLYEANTRVFSKYKQVSATFMSTSRFYYNYRHPGNVFAVLSQYVKHGQLSNKYLTPIMPETCVCHPINTAAGRIYLDSTVNLDHYAAKISEDESNNYYEDLLIKYNGHGLMKKHFRYIMTKRYPRNMPNSLKVLTNYSVEEDPEYTKFIYMTGHGGDSYLQFQAKDFISSLEMGQNFKEMYIKDPKMKIFTLLDTCQASTMYNYVDKEIPLVWVASSVRGESSYSHNPNPYISISTCDKFTYVLRNYLNTVLSGIIYGTDKASVSRLSLKQLLRNYERNSKKERVKYEVSKKLYENEEEVSTMEKIYLGQFIFNYRKIYINSLKFGVRKNNKNRGTRMKNFKIKGVKYEEEVENTSLLQKAKEAILRIRYP
ncbi:GPI anchor transamidase [Theileria orientalis]|uniref:GPI anchor transamidase n=1 Tax=Theileria orientalis TaxID=68886 RepID=A0A976MB05_THEOR|nr:GPI anchor transamidase [Theileria orientalis]